MRTIGTGLSEWAVTGFPSASRISSALPWSAVTSARPRGPRVARVDIVDRGTTRARQPSRVSAARTVASQIPVWPTMSAFA